MNPLDAKRFVRMFQEEVDLSRPIEPQLDVLFTLGWNEVVTKKSWKGRLATFFTLPFYRRETERRVHGLFAEAIALDSGQIKIASSEVNKFIKKAIHLNLYKPSSAVATALSEAPEIDTLRKEVEKLSPKEGPEHFPHSLLHKDRHEAPLSLGLLDALFFHDELDNDQISAIEIYLERHPSDRLEEQKKWLNRWREKNEIERNCIKSLDKASDEERYQFIRVQAEAMHEKIVGLADGGEESVVFFHHYGSRRTFFELMMPYLRKISTLNNQIPSATLEDILRTKKIPPPERLAELLLLDFKNYFDKSGSEGEEKTGIDLTIFENLLPDEQRNLDGFLIRILPEVFRFQISKLAQKGVLGTLTASFVEPKSSKHILEFLKIIKKGFEDRKKTGSTKVTLESLTYLLKENESKYTTLIHNATEELLKRIIATTPGLLFEVAECDDQFLRGDIWLEFRKQRDNKLSLQIYANGHAQQFHPQGHPFFQINEIEGDKITPDFFENLLIRNWGSLWNPESGSKAVDFYRGPLEELGGGFQPLQVGQSDYRQSHL